MISSTDVRVLFSLLCTTCLIVMSVTSCSSDLDCSLNGVCTSGVCKCREPWTGSANCSQLVFLPTPTLRGYPNPNAGPTWNATSSWGGSAALGDDGLYHLFVSESVNDCPLKLWTSNMRCSHTVSEDPLGPYTFRNVAVDVWCTNPAVVTQKNHTTGSTTWFLFHMGDGAPRKPIQNCTNGTSTSAPERTHDLIAQSKYIVSGLHVASSPDGPFEYVNMTVDNCNNPSPLIHPNGTWYVVCHHFDVYRAESFRGPWVKINTELGPLPNGDGSEDPYLFIDKAGYWHVLWHASRKGSDEDNCNKGHAGSIVAAHTYSTNGFEWHLSGSEPYTNIIEMEGNISTLVATRERPKFIYNTEGVPTHLINGITTATSCSPTPCINCKYEAWAMTNISPLLASSS